MTTFSSTRPLTDSRHPTEHHHKSSFYEERMRAALIKQHEPIVARFAPAVSAAFTQLLPPSLPSLSVTRDPILAKQARREIREGRYSGPTAKLAPGFIQANMVTVERQYAFDFLMFAMSNSKPCPLLDVVVGPSFESKLAKGSDLRRDVPKYRLWQHGRVIDEPTDVSSVWPDDAVSFLLGCSFTFENDLKRRGLLQKESSSVPMFKTQVENNPCGPFKGRLVVSMRLFHPDHVEDAIRITEAHPLSHGGPVAVGLEGQKELGIADITKPDYGEAPDLSRARGLIPVFWACGVTPQTAIEEAKDQIKGLVITHAPGCMFITDIHSNPSIADDLS